MSLKTFLFLSDHILKLLVCFETLHNLLIFIKNSFLVLSDLEFFLLDNS